MKKIVIVIYIILLLILLKLIATFITNEIFISKYNERIYNPNDVKNLFILNIFEPYTAYYNHGNILYYNNDFDGAIEKYNKALELSPPEDKERDIKINLELAKLKKENIEEDKEDQEEQEEQEEQETDEEKKEDKQKEKQKQTDKIEEQLKEMQNYILKMQISFLLMQSS